MAIQIIPKPEERSPRGLDLLFYSSLILVIAAILSYFILGNLQKNTEERLQTLEEELEQLAFSPEAALEREILAYQEKINIFAGLLANHRYSSQLFSFIESITHPRVSFSSFSAENDANTVHLSGSTDGFQTLQQQLIIFQNEKLIKETELSGVTLDESGRVSFNFDLTLDSKIFNKQ